MLKKNIAVLSLPRSGSTWFAERVKTKYGMNYIDEPLRTGFGQPENSLYHSKILTDVDYNNPSFWDKLDPITRCKLETIKKINEYENVLLKETNNLFQIDFLKNLLPNYEFIFLQRHLGGVLNSLLKVENVWEKWSFDDRANTLMENLRSEIDKEAHSGDLFIQKCINDYKRRIHEFITIFNNAKEVEIRGDKENALILAYLTVQSLEARSKVDRIINYEDIATHGIPNDIFPKMMPRGKIKDLESTNRKYETHSTRNPSIPNAWIHSFSEHDWKAVYYMLGKYASMVFPIIENQEKESKNIPEIIFLEANNQFISNRPVSCQEFENFMSEIVTEGISYEDLFNKLGFRPSSTHNFGETNGSYFSLHPEKPITHVSPLGVLAYSIYYGYSLPSVETYEFLQKRFSSFIPSAENTNFDDYSKLHKISVKPQVGGFIDLFGNVSEIAIDGNGEFYKVGGSYKDSSERLSLDSPMPMMWFQRDTETSFRLAASMGRDKLLQGKVKDIIKLNSNPETIKMKLLSLIKN